MASVAFHLANKVALVTGAASGLGQHIAVRFAQAGASVVATDLRMSNATIDQISQAGARGLALNMNVADERQVNDGFQLAVKEFGKIDIVVANAGVQHIDPVKDLSFENWRKVISVNLDGAFLTARAAMRTMIEKKNGGRILFIGSAHSRDVSVLKAPYCAAKHGLLGLSKVIAKEGAEYDIATNVICPGFVRTPLVEKQIPEQAANLGISQEEVVKNIMLRNTVDGEFTTLDDVADITLFLASVSTKAFTGQSIGATHGWAMV